MRKKILLVEDMDQWIYRITNILDKEYLIDFAKEADTAIKLFNNTKYDLVLLERAMNNLNLPSWFDKKWLMEEIRVDEESFSDLVEVTATKKLSYKDVGKKLASIKSIEQQGTVDKKLYGDISSADFIKLSTSSIIPSSKRAFKRFVILFLLVFLSTSIPIKTVLNFG